MMRCLWIGLMLLLPLVAAMQDYGRKVPRKIIASTSGRVLYLTYCASCHGKDGKGDGPVAPALKDPLPDLTALARRRGGVFPAAEVEKLLSGEGEMRTAHGSGDMPVWGRVFRGAADGRGPERVRQLVNYLGKLQAK